LFGSFAAAAGEGAGAPGPLRGCSVSDFLFSRTNSSAHRIYFASVPCWWQWTWLSVSLAFY
jgi:hypothetical protein